MAKAAYLQVDHANVQGWASERAVLSALYHLINEGYIEKAWQTEPGSIDDRKGVDIRMAMRINGKRIEIPLQVKSSAYGVQAHNSRPDQDIACVNGQSPTLQEDLLEIIGQYSGIPSKSVKKKVKDTLGPARRSIHNEMKTEGRLGIIEAAKQSGIPRSSLARAVRLGEVDAKVYKWVGDKIVYGVRLDDVIKYKKARPGSGSRKGGAREPMCQAQKEGYLLREDAAKVLGVDKTRINQLYKSGALTGKKFPYGNQGFSVLGICPKSLEAYQASRQQKKEKPAPMEKTTEKKPQVTPNLAPLLCGGRSLMLDLMLHLHRNQGYDKRTAYTEALEWSEAING